MTFFVYMLASKKDGVLYTGVTSDLHKRIYEHQHGITGGFTSRCHVRRLVYYEIFDDVEHAILHEKRLKKWRKAWKKALIEQKNPEWNDSSGTL